MTLRKYLYATRLSYDPGTLLCLLLIWRLSVAGRHGSVRGLSRAQSCGSALP
jgi:hypothetical protein